MSLEVLSFLYENPTRSPTLGEIADAVDISRSTVYTTVPKMQADGLVTARFQTRRSKNGEISHRVYSLSLRGRQMLEKLLP